MCCRPTSGSQERPTHPGREVTSHLDIAPTLVSLTNASPEKKAAITRQLRGKDLSSPLAAPEQASATAVRDGALYCYNMLAYIDGGFMAERPDRKGSRRGRRPDAARRRRQRPGRDGRRVRRVSRDRAPWAPAAWAPYAPGVRAARPGACRARHPCRIILAALEQTQPAPPE